MNTSTQTITIEKYGMTVSIIAIVLAILGIFTIGTLFVPLAFICTLFALYRSIRHKYFPATGMAALAFVLCLVGLFTSPALLVLLSMA